MVFTDLLRVEDMKFDPKDHVLILANDSLMSMHVINRDMLVKQVKELLNEGNDPGIMDLLRSMTRRLILK